MSAGPLGPVVRRPEQVPPRSLGAGASVLEMLNDEHGCQGLHQRRLRLAAGASLSAVADGRGEAWYVISGSGELDGSVRLEPGTAVWLEPGQGYRVTAARRLEVLAVTVHATTERAEGTEVPGTHVVRLADCAVERTGDREFRVLLSAGLSLTQFAGTIPPGRAPEHQHTYDEVVHVLAGRGVVHLAGADTEIGPGTSIYLPPGQPHCLENTGTEPLQVLGVFHPAGSPAAKRET